jgi:SAM-dependent methyltransferase
VNWNNQTIRDLERASIREFVRENAHLLTGRVLDYGCGKSPYREYVTGEYVGYDAGLPGYKAVGDESVLQDEEFDAVLLTQVLQYCPEPKKTVLEISRLLKSGGHLLLTYQTNWDEVEPSDINRLTYSGVEDIIPRELTIVSHKRRAEINLGGFKFPLGGALVAQRV